MEGVEEANSPPAFKVSEEEGGRVTKEAGRCHLYQGDDEEEVAKCRPRGMIVERNRIWKSLRRLPTN